MATVVVKANLAGLQRDPFTTGLNRDTTGGAVRVHHQGMTSTAVVDEIEGDDMIGGLRRSTRKDATHLKSRPVARHDSATRSLQWPSDPIQGRLLNGGGEPLYLTLAQVQAMQASPAPRLLRVEQRA